MQHPVILCFCVGSPLLAADIGGTKGLNPFSLPPCHDLLFFLTFFSLFRHSLSSKEPTGSLSMDVKLFPS